MRTLLSRHSFLVLGVLALGGLAPLAESYAQTRYGEEGQGVEAQPGLVVSGGGVTSKKNKVRLSPGVSVPLAQCNRNRAACLCPRGYMKLEGFEGSAQSGVNQNVLEVNKLKLKHVVQCVSPCQDGSSPGLTVAASGKLKASCLGGQ